MFTIMNKNHLYLFLILLFYNGFKHRKYLLFFIFKHTKKGRKMLKEQKEKALITIKDKLFSKKYLINFTELPRNGVNDDDVKEILDRRRSLVNNKISGCVYSGNYSNNLVKYVNNLYLYSNPLHPDIYPELIKMESEIVKMIG